MLNVVKNNFSFVISIIILQSTMTFSFEMTDEGINKAIENYYLMHTQNDIYPTLVQSGLGINQEDFSNRVTEMIREHSDVFHYIAEAQIDLEILPYIEKYNTLKMRFTGQPINPNIKVLFASNSTKRTSHNMTFSFAGICDEFTRTVFLDRDFWNYHKNNEEVRESLLFHELGHCDLMRRHLDGFNDVDDAIDARQPYFSFMYIDSLQIFILSKLFNRRVNRQCSRESMEKYIRKESYPSGCSPNIEFYYYEHIFNSDLSRVFEEAYKELFSIRNNLSEVHAIVDTDSLPKCFVSYDYASFESIRIPVLKHLTTGPAITPYLENFYNTQIDTRRREVSHPIRCDQLY